MSQSGMAPSSVHITESSTQRVRNVANEQSIQELLEVFNDADCRTILETTSDTALSAKEICESCDIPLSTTYRKLELLTRAGLLEERTCIRRSGHHASKYSRSVDGINLMISSQGEMKLQVSYSEASGQVDSSTPVLEE